MRARRQQWNPTIVCAWCESVLEKGSSQISHGICRPCAAEFIAAATGEAVPVAHRKLAVAS